MAVDKTIVQKYVKYTVVAIVMALLVVQVAYQSHVIGNLNHHMETIKKEQARHRMRRSLDQDGDTATQRPDVVDVVKGGATYVRWGKLNCSGPDTETVYSGSAGGSNSNADGGASNYLCLPDDPQWGSYNEIAEGTGEIYGVEFEMENFPFIVSALGPENLRSHNMPCAVCRTVTRSTALMVPARVDCYPGWTREYRGYLVSGHKLHKGRSEYICVDIAPDVEPAGYRRDTSATIFTVDAVCGSLPCPPYFGGRELSCTVCTK